MNRILVLISILFALGIAISSILQNLIFSPFLIFISLLIFIFFSIGAYIKRWDKLKYLILLDFFLAGFLYGQSALFQTRHNSLEGLTNKTVTLEGIVAGDNLYRNDEISFTLNSYRAIIQDKSYRISQKVIVNVRGNKEVFTGQRMILKGILTLPPAARNPCEFSYRDYLLLKSIHNIVRVNSFDDIKILDYGKTGSLTLLAAKIKRKCLIIISELMEEPERSVLSGMILGTRISIPDNMLKAFQTTGTVHILQSSGFNISILLVIIVFLGELLRVSYRRSAIICIPLVICYAFIAWGHTSVIRASIMTVIVLSGLIIEREPDIFTSVFASAFLILIISPLQLYDAGFQLSFAAIISIICFTRPLEKFFYFIPFRAIRTSIAVPCAVQLGISPIVIYYFNQISLVGVLANLVIFMFIGFTFGLGIFMLALYPLFPPGGVILSRIVGILVDYIIFIVSFLAKIPFASINIASPSIYFIIFYYIFIFFFIALFQNYKKWKEYAVEKWGFMLTRGKIFITLLAICLLFIWYPLLFPNPFKVVFLDVGQGDSIFIKLPCGKCFLIDGGKGTEYFDAGKSVILPFLQRYGVGQLDGIFLTHTDNDHLGGLVEVLKNIKVKALYEGLDFDPASMQYRELSYLIVKKGIRHYRLGRGDKLFTSDGVTFEILNPSLPLIPAENHLNENCLVLRICLGKISFLMAGDMEQKAEERVLSNPLGINSQILKVAHHGSPYGSCKEFLQKVRPEVAVISAGAKNPYGHPSPAVLDRLKFFSCSIYRTDYDGAVTITSDGRSYKVSTVKKLNDRSVVDEIYQN